MAIEHNVITDAERHEPKGLSTALNGQVYLARGSDTGAWVYLPVGWGYYADNTAGQTVNTVASKLSVNGLGSASESGYLPREIRGSSELWDTSADKITPIAAGDTYNIQLQLPITADTGTPTVLDIALDIGGAATPSNIQTARDISVSKTPPYTVSVGFPIFCLATFITNGGQFFLSTDTGTVTIVGATILIDRNTSGAI